MIIIRNYEQARKLWENTAPIRGRAEDVRPLGKRRRDWETIVRVSLGEGENYAYAARLHSTNVVTWYPDGTMALHANGWHTPSTSAFINSVCIFNCVKTRRKLWITCRQWDTGTSIKYPLPDKQPLHMHYVDDQWRPVGDYQPTQSYTDRRATKTLHQQAKPFLDWARVTLSLCDGRIAQETIDATLPPVQFTTYAGLLKTHPSLPHGLLAGLGMPERNLPDQSRTIHVGVIWSSLYTKQTPIDTFLANLTEDKFLPVLCALSTTSALKDESGRFDFNKLKAFIYRLIRQLPDCQGQMPYTPTDRFADNVR